MKYIVTRCENGKEELFMFPKTIDHDKFADAVQGLKKGSGRDWVRIYRTPIAAGFTDGIKCVGRSETLNLDSRGRLDEMLIEV